MIAGLINAVALAAINAVALAALCSPLTSIDPSARGAPPAGTIASCACTGDVAKARPTPAAHARARAPNVRRRMTSNGFHNAKQASPSDTRTNPGGSGITVVEAVVLRNRVSTAKSVVLHPPGLDGVQELIPNCRPVISLV